MKHYFLLIGLLCGTISSGMAQFTLSGEFRPRTEYTHGFKQLASNEMDYGLFTSQRTRLNFQFQNESLLTKVALQDIRVFGATPQLNESDAFSSLHEAWAELKLYEAFSLRIGRQELDYDDARILGNVAWAQQARSHDLFLLKYEGSFNIHAGWALNNHTQNLTSGLYDIGKNYKAMQFLWFHKRSEAFQLSLLALNNGMQYYDYDENGAISDYHTAYSQTLGGRFVYQKNSFRFNTNAYAQLGKDPSNQELAAYNLLLEGFYRVSKPWNVGLGYELLSGGSEIQSDGTVRNLAFNPLYGTNHKFNGLMDYFYVGNHLNSVGLSDIYLMTQYKASPKLIFNAHLHHFSAATDIVAVNPAMNPTETYERPLGIELDVFVNYFFHSPEGNKVASFTLGYSQIQGTSSLQLLKGGSTEAISNWAWLMITYTPQFFKTPKV